MRQRCPGRGDYRLQR